jgi:single-stranded DNA-binding protein
VADNCYFGDSKREEGSSYGGNTYGGNSYGNNNYGGYNAPAPSYGGYSAPAAAPASDFAMLEDDDAQLPF